jgi:hypothetical protein
MSDETKDDELDAALASMPALDVSEWSRARIKKRSLETLSAAGAPAWIRALERAYALVLEPALVFGVAPLYLVWAFSTVVAIYSAAG